MKKNSISIGLLILTVLTMSFICLNDWILFETKDCKIYFPKKPTEESKIVNSAVGELKLNIYMYEAPAGEKDSNLVYGLMQSEYPDSLINSDKKDILDQFFRNSVDGTVTNVQGKLLSETKIAYDTFPGREIKVDFKDGLAIIKMRLYLVKNKMYIIQTITYPKNDFNKSIDRFMNSFSITK